MLNGRRPPRSKIEPRSTKNGSSRWPAKTCEPSESVFTAAAVIASYCPESFGVERGPMFTGGTGRLSPSTVEVPSLRTSVTEYVCGRFQLALSSEVIGPVL